ncbi:hypothetical protein [Mycolicibacterium sp. XJ870]
MAESPAPQAVRPSSLADAIIPLVALAVLIASSVALFGLGGLDGPILVALVLCWLVAALIAPPLSVIYGDTGFKIVRLQGIGDET